MINDKPNQTVFLTKVRSKWEFPHAQMLINSIRAFGGGLRSCPIWIFDASPQKAANKSLRSTNVQVLPLDLPSTVKNYDFGDKVYACARAEELVSSKVRSLIWVDPLFLFIQPPTLLKLGPAYDAAVRPVHIRNVGLLASEPVDAFWKKIYQTVGVEDIKMWVDSFVDDQHLWAYFNTHAFAINPSKKLLRQWFESFEKLVCDQGFQASDCRDELHQVFLHQAVLSALIATRLDPNRVHILPPEYNYPYNLHPSIPPERRAKALNDLVSICLEERSLDPETIKDILIEEPLRTWLSERVNQDK